MNQPVGYSRRIIDAELDELLPALPAIALEGPKGVGKTATALRRARTVYRLDVRAQQLAVEAATEVALRAPAPVLFDEWQRYRAIWDDVRRAVDGGAAPGSYVLTGSAVPSHQDGAGPTHTGAGRIVSLRMRPLSLAERNLGPATVRLTDLLHGGRPEIGGTSRVDVVAYAREIVASGFPGIRALPGRARRAQLDGYLTRVVDRDFEEAGHKVRRPDALRRWMRSYAAATATVTTLEKIRDASTGGEGETLAKTSVLAYRDVLERLFLLEPVPGWLPSRNHLNRLTQAPRHHLADPALAARLLGADEGALLHGVVSPLFDDAIHPPDRRMRAVAPRDGTLFGQLFESLVTQSVRVYAQSAEATVHHLRVEDGRHEVDLIVQRSDHRVVALEVKLSPVVADDDVKHLLWLREVLQEDLLDAAVITTGTQAYRRRDGIAVIPAALLAA
ncbi:MAG: DUF4143 domain-containing protein [Gemmatimonadaceae bacterium]|jgi:hypothetical protein|nr:DUF4143 domain-containing protein [Gemmatimonadaceae bacterium]